MAMLAFVFFLIILFLLLYLFKNEIYLSFNVGFKMGKILNFSSSPLVATAQFELAVAKLVCLLEDLSPLSHTLSLSLSLIPP
jgi:hypothetical protein